MLGAVPALEGLESGGRGDDYMVLWEAAFRVPPAEGLTSPGLWETCQRK